MVELQKRKPETIKD